MLTTTSHYHPPQCSPSQHEAYIFTPVTSPAAVAALPGQDDDKREGLEYSAEPYYRNHYQMSLEISKDEDEYFKPPADINVSLPATNGTQALSVPTSLHSTHGFTSDDSLVLPRTFYNTDQQLFPISSFQQQAPPPSLSIIRHPEHHQSSIQHSKASESLTTAYTSTASTVSTAPARSLPLTYPFLVAPTDATGPYAQPSPSPSASSVAPTTPASTEVRFSVILQAPTAATQISDGPPTTYLNRGQPYWLRLIDKYEDDVVVRSTLLILFHEPAHRKVASDYWKFWRSQQPNPQTARAIFLDEQCPPEGIYNVRFPSFDRIEFEWNSRMGAKMLIKFNCLSTDFSRIKGVKGIPLRVQMESREINAVTSNRHVFQTEQYVEQSYCKIKLFRDKGAERKNKDDAKQIWKHMERIYGFGRQQPYWLIYNQPRPYTVFRSIGSIPSSPQSNAAENLSCENSNSSSFREGRARKRHKTLTQHQVDAGQSGHNPPVPRSSACEMAGNISVASAASSESPISSAVLESSGLPPPIPTQCSFFIHVKTTQCHEPCLQGGKKRCLHPIQLDEKRTRITDLISLVCSVLSLDSSQVSEILWKQQRHGSSQSTADSVLLPVTGADDDSSHFPITRKITRGAIVSVEWEIIANGSVRLLFGF